VHSTEQDIREAITKSKTLSEAAQALGFGYLNGRVQKKIQGWIDRYGIDTSHFDKKHKTRKYPVVIKTCPVCSKEFTTQIGNKEERVTCSHSCANKHFAASKHTDEANDKRRNALLKHPKIIRFRTIRASRETEIECGWCETKFKTSDSKTFCNNSCASHFRMSQPHAREKSRNVQLALVASGKHKGWLSRWKMKQSFPEKVSEECIVELGFQRNTDYKYELPAGRWFIDFAFESKMIAIEIDGKQHTYPDRVAKDKEKDEYLTSAGWAVYRIPWKRLTKETRAELKQKLTDILLNIRP